jgi:hypothetical protein
MTAVPVERQLFHATHGGDGQRVVQVRKQLAVARDLPSQRRGEGIGIDIQEQQVALTRVMLRRGLGRLQGGREVDEAVADVMRGAGEGSSGSRGGPVGATDDAVDGAHGMADTTEPPTDHHDRASNIATGAASKAPAFQEKAHSRVDAAIDALRKAQLAKLRAGYVLDGPHIVARVDFGNTFRSIDVAKVDAVARTVRFEPNK